MIKKFYRLSIAFIAVFVINVANTHAKAQNNGYIINITDIHFDPFYDSSIVHELITSDVKKWDSIFQKSKIDSFGSYSADTNYNLFESALKSIKENSPHPDFIVYSGDFICHNFNTQFASFDKAAATAGSNSNKNTVSLSKRRLHRFIYKTVEYVVMKLSEIFPNTPLYLALGNFDSYIGNYQVEVNGAFLKDTSKLFMKKIFFSSPNQKSEFEKTYRYGGYYNAGVPNNERAEIIVMNSIFYSPSYEYKGEPDTHPGHKELAWFEKKLRKAVKNNKKVWIVTHIPLGVDVYSSLIKPQNRNGRITGNPVMYYKNNFNAGFMDIIREFHKNIEVILVGHTHMDWFELYKDDDEKYIAYNHLAPAISPAFGNNPAYQIITYDRNKFKLKDYTVYFLNLDKAAEAPNDAQWEKEYTFTEAYKKETYNLKSLINVYTSMINNESKEMKDYVKFYTVRSTAKSYIDTENWFNFYLAIGYLIQDKFMNKIDEKL